ncbi:MAG: hypothetical protein OEZ03_15080 [Alphaproteobacteria bacterium]|nr:hypothetical protein [Alphaproteobacteria bacterium]MDH5558671.1 hypothetical protein [Alphaproteobacteria bacterium]
MRPLADIEAGIDYLERNAARPAEAAAEFLKFGEEIVEHWLTAHDKAPTDALKEGFRLLALHRQAAQGDPSFNACRETCRELVYYFNLITLDPLHGETNRRLAMMAMVARHLYLFITGKMQVAELGDFCCASRPLRTNAN